MSGIINKVKDALSSDKNDNPRSDNHGPHGSNVANSADPRVDSDLDGRHTTTSGYGSNTHGTTGSGYTGTTGHSTTAGPHSSNLANKADPRVDSDLDGGRTLGSSTGAYGSSATGNYGSSTGTHGIHGTHGTHGTHGSSTTTYGETPIHNATTIGGHSGSSTNAGPHSSNLANKLDPRVDSDRDGRNDPTSTYGSTTSGGAYTSSTASGSTNQGPHSSNYANKLDPRVDSDRDNRNDPTSRVGGYGGQENYGVSGSNPAPSSGYGNTGYTGATGTHGTHGTHGTTGTSGYGTGATGTSGLGHSGTAGGYGQSGTTGYDQSGTTGYGQSGTTGYGQSGTTGYGETGAGQYGSSATPGSGQTAGTAGPHNSNLLNKLDPRVDSDLDGSKTYGGNQTHR